MDQKDNLLGVLKTLFKWKKQILYTCLAAGIGSIIIVLLLPVYYKATTIFLVASPDQAKPELLFGKGTLESEYYGTESDIDRILTIAKSNELIEFLVDSFQLYKHYDIKQENPRSPYYVKLAFNKRFDIEKTKRDAIELSIEDTDREFAAQIARATRERIDDIAQKLVKKTQLKAIETYQSEINSQEKNMRVLADTLASLRKKYGIYNSDAQTESITDQFAQSESRLINGQARLEAMEASSRIHRDTILMLKAKVRGMEVEVNSLNEKINNLNTGLGIVSSLERQYQESSISLSENKERLKQFEAAYESNIPALLLVEEAQVPIIKSRPKRTLIVVAAVFVAFLFSVIGVLLFDNFKDTNWREIYYGK
ncbi:MAG: hypothetical protein DHS20C18_48250 [Saprospiraceae bacterium]|nr:MAG: hypothetical protein DHS20C18_48250 [Saprospiraceae bacterium]